MPNLNNKPMIKSSAFFLAFILLSFFLALCVSSVRHKTLTLDEPYHYHYGTRLLFEGNPSRIGRFDDSKMPFTVLNVLPRAAGNFLPAGPLKRFLLKTETGRFATLLVAVILGFYVFRWSRELYGPMAGLWSLVFYCLSPSIIAHSRLITTDLYSACMTTLSLYYFRRFLNNPRGRLAVKSALTLGIAQLAKYFCLFLYPIFGLILLVRGMRTFIKERTLQSWPSRGKAGLFYTVFFLLVSLLIIHLGFLFHQPLTPWDAYEFKSPLFKTIQAHLDVFKVIPPPFPKPYLIGIDLIQYHSEYEFLSHTYLWGVLKEKGEGFRSYYLTAILFKTPLPVLFAIFFAVALYIRGRRRYSFFEDELFLIIPAAFFLIHFSFFLERQNGIRQILMIFPLLFIFCGCAFKDRGWSDLKLKHKFFIIAFTVYLLASNLSYFPHYLSYFNELAWDRKMAYRILADSNIEWGQNKRYLREYQKENPDTQLRPKQPTSGKIVVDANDLAGVWDPEKYRWLRENFKPADHIAYSYLVFEIPEEKLLEIRDNRSSERSSGQS